MVLHKRENNKRKAIGRKEAMKMKRGGAERFGLRSVDGIHMQDQIDETTTVTEFVVVLFRVKSSHTEHTTHDTNESRRSETYIRIHGQSDNVMWRGGAVIYP